jgi:hypothetical protein
MQALTKKSPNNRIEYYVVPAAAFGSVKSGRLHMKLAVRFKLIAGNT